MELVPANVKTDVIDDTTLKPETMEEVHLMQQQEQKGDLPSDEPKDDKEHQVVLPDASSSNLEHSLDNLATAVRSLEQEVKKMSDHLKKLEMEYDGREMDKQLASSQDSQQQSRPGAPVAATAASGCRTVAKCILCLVMFGVSFIGTLVVLGHVHPLPEFD